MKNYEKYAYEIREYKGINFCAKFIKPHILKEDSCCGLDCIRCNTLQLLWLLEEYEEPKEPEVDWSKVAVDTPIVVRNFETGNWYKRYFAKFEDGKVYAWIDGRTSWNSDDETHGWKHAKLSEQEESDE